MQEFKKLAHNSHQRLCYFHFTSSCKYGSFCRFSHTSPYNLNLLKKIEENIADFELAVGQVSKEIRRNKLPNQSSLDMKSAMNTLYKHFKDFEHDYKQRYHSEIGIFSEKQQSNTSKSKHSKRRSRSRSRSITRSTSDTTDDDNQHRSKTNRSHRSTTNYKIERSFLDFIDKKETTGEQIEAPILKIQDTDLVLSPKSESHIETWHISEYDLDPATILLEVPCSTIDDSPEHHTALRYSNPHVQSLDFIPIPTQRSSSAFIDPRINAKLQYLGYNCIITEPRSFMRVDKFNIVIDLDRTLIETILKTDLIIPIQNYNYRIEEINWSFKGVPHCYIVAIRPGIQDFLDKLSAFATLWLYTSAIQDYAVQVVKILDPDGKYFSDRIIGSTTISETKESKSLSKILSKFPEFDTSVCCILDDNIAVWINDKDKLIPTMAFSPFKTYGNSKFTYHPMLTNYKFEDQKERFLDKDGTQLGPLTDILMRTYREFVLHSCKITAAHAYELIRKRTLKGTQLSFNSYISRLDDKLYSGSKLQTYVYIAELLGAQITKENTREVVEKAASGEEVTGCQLLNSYFSLCSL